MPSVRSGLKALSAEAPAASAATLSKAQGEAVALQTSAIRAEGRAGAHYCTSGNRKQPV